MRNIYQLENVKSYATEKALMKKLEEMMKPYISEYADRAFVVMTKDGRYTAIISLDMSKGGYLGRYASQGFMSV